MISIKKVEVTPIDRNIAKVVDSTATQDDKTKNTYSMRVIDSQLDDKVDGQFLVNNYYSKTDSYSKDEVDGLLTEAETVTYTLKAVNLPATGNIDFSNPATAQILFKKRNGMIYIQISCHTVSSVDQGYIGFFNQDNTPFVVPDEYKFSGTAITRFFSDNNTPYVIYYSNSMSISIGEDYTFEGAGFVIQDINNSTFTPITNFSILYNTTNMAINP